MAFVGVFVLLVLLLILLLSLPLDLALHLRTGKERRFRVTVSWLFGIVQRDLVGEKRRPKKPRRKKKERRRGFPSLLISRGLILRLVKLLRELLSRIAMRELVASFRIGLDDPADTGMVYGLVCATLPALGLWSKARIGVAPAFDEALFEASIDGAVRIYPITLLPPCLRFAFSPEVWWIIGRRVFRR